MRRWLLRLLLPRAAPDGDCELVLARREGRCVAVTFVQGGRTISYLLPRHRAKRLIAEIAGAL